MQVFNITMAKDASFCPYTFVKFANMYIQDISF